MFYKPHAYQEHGRRFMLTHPATAGFMDMGLGKTVTTLTAFNDLWTGLQVRAMLVLAPIRVVENVWPDEVEKWDHLRHLRVSIVRGSPVSRPITVRDRLLDEQEHRMSKPSASAADALRPGFDVYLTNYENLPALCLWMTKQTELPFDMVVYDESTKMKSASARRFKLLKPHLSKFKRAVLLTGTPTPNSYLDLWSQIYLLDQGARLSDFVTHYKDRYFSVNRYSFEVKLKPGADVAIRKRIADISLCLRSEDYLTLPPVVENTIKLDMPAKLRQRYDTFRQELAMTLDKISVEAFNAASLSNKCRQFTSGAVYETAPRPTGKWEALHDLKLDAVEDVIEEANGESVLVVYEFKHELERLRKRWPKAPWIGGGCKDADRSIREWNKGKHRVMLAHPASLGHGVNLQDGGRIMVWTSGSWSYELYAQMVKRLHRQGQRGKVFVHRLCMRSTVDDVVMATLDGKHKSQRELLVALRSHVKVA